ncbi:MAG TPA: hypothetical protein VMR37_06195 [Rhabdochlamydiaceae bacterium]|nr:hypothetical protein [Rhabdochlamydiaceae bacterium]
MKNLDELLEEAKWGKLTEKEIASVAEKIKAAGPDEDSDLYTLIHILGRAEATQYKKLVEKFLYYPTSPIISSIALKTLCNYWGSAHEYLDKIKSFIKGVEWDPDNDVRLIALSCAGQYLKESQDKELLQLLLSTYENEEEDELCREAAYEAIALAMGQTWNEILNEERNFQ